MALTQLPSGRTVYDTGKVQVGLRAPDRAPVVSADAERIQTALLQPIPVGWPWWFRVWHWLAGPR